MIESVHPPSHQYPNRSKLTPYPTRRPSHQKISKPCLQMSLRGQRRSISSSRHSSSRHYKTPRGNFSSGLLGRKKSTCKFHNSLFTIHSTVHTTYAYITINLVSLFSFSFSNRKRDLNSEESLVLSHISAAGNEGRNHIPSLKILQIIPENSE